MRDKKSILETSKRYSIDDIEVRSIDDFLGPINIPENSTSDEVNKIKENKLKSLIDLLGLKTIK